MALEKVIVTLDDACRESSDAFADAVAECSSAGLDVKDTLKRVGVVTGTIDSAQIDVLSKTPHVVRVEPDRKRFAL